jgi:hypothetical protein
MKIPLLRSTSGLTHTWVQEDDHWRIASSQDTGPYLDQNKAMANENDGYSPSRDLRRVARIPYIVQQLWLNEEGWDAFDPAHADKLAAKLNSSEWAHLRTAPGRVAVSNGIMR